MPMVGGKPATQLTNLNVSDTLFVKGVQVGDLSYISAQRTTDLAVSLTPAKVSFDSILINKDITVESGTDFVLSKGGTYQLSVSAVFEKVIAGGVDTGFVWIQINNVDVPGSAIPIVMSTQSSLFSGSFLAAIGNVNAGDKVSIVVSADSAINTQLSADIAMGGPAVSSCDINIFQIEGSNA